MAAGCAVFLVGQSSGERTGVRLATALPVIRRVLAVHDLPLIARVEWSGEIAVLLSDGEQLDPIRRIRPKLSDRA